MLLQLVITSSLRALSILWWWWVGLVWRVALEWSELTLGAEVGVLPVRHRRRTRQEPIPRMRIH